MDFVVEDGTGLANANSYVTVDYADTYFSQRGVTQWAELSIEDRQFALVKATDYIDSRFAKNFTTKSLNSEQALVLPKRYFIDANLNRVRGIPNLWLKAVCEYALVASTRDLFATPLPVGTKDVKSKEVVVGPVKTKTEYNDSPAQGDFAVYASADRLVFQLLGSTTGRVIR